MDDLNRKLAEILGDEESMSRVRKMAESILGEEAPKEESDGGFSSLLKADEMSSLLSVIGRLKAQNDDDRTRLLTALKPHLCEKRREKVDTAIKILKIIEILPLIKETGLLNI